MSTAARVLSLVALWLLAWGDASLPNIATGLLLSAGLLAVFPGRRTTTSTRVSPAGVARLVLHVLGELVTSNVLVAREVVSRRSRVRTGVLAYEVQHPSDELLSLLANVLALTPGTMTVEATRDPAVLYIHFLLLDDLEAARRTVARLERRAVAALGGPPPAPGPTAQTRGGP